jgi:pimeloyl-ACP methyl ester carboxylesterase
MTATTGVATPAQPDATATLLPTATVVPATPTPSLESGMLVDIGDHSLWIRCYGTGATTVVFESPGFFGNHLGLVELPDTVAAFAHVCVYDRSNSGKSDVGLFPTTIQQSADELRLLLLAADVHIPVVLAGYSMGGAISRLYAASYPDDVTGLVLIDPTDAETLRKFAARDPQYYHIDVATSADQMSNAGPPPDIPVVIISNDSPTTPAEVITAWQEQHAAFAATLPQGRHVIAEDSEHSMMLETHLDLIAGLVHEVVDAVER